MVTGMLAACALALIGAEPLYEARYIWDAEADPSHGHVHASCIVELPNGDLLTAWYENSDPMPPPYYSGDRDKRDDVRIGGSRLRAGADAWETPFVMADTYGVSDNNPCMVVDHEGRLWLFYPTLLGVPDWTWGSALVRYAVSTRHDGPGAPEWDNEEILIPRPEGFEALIEARLAELEAQAGESERIRNYLIRVKDQLDNPLIKRLGWMPRAHPLVRSDGTLVLPLSNENFSIAMMFFTKDGGATWTASQPVPEMGLTQPSVAEFPDGTLAAFFRNSSGRIKRSDSTDGGTTWGPTTQTELLHPGAGIEAIVLDNGHLAMIYNDKTESPRDKLAVSISDDQGKTWRWTRHLEDTPGGRFDYPSMVQAKDGTLHASYSYNLETIKHVHFNEAWVQQGD